MTRMSAREDRHESHSSSTSDTFEASTKGIKRMCAERSEVLLQGRRTYQVSAAAWPATRCHLMP